MRELWEHFFLQANLLFFLGMDGRVSCCSPSEEEVFGF